MKSKISLRSIEDVKEFVAIATKCEFDIDVQYNHIVLDGKSLVGMMNIELNRELTVYSKDTNSVFEAMLRKFERRNV